MDLNQLCINLVGFRLWDGILGYQDVGLGKWVV